MSIKPRLERLTAPAYKLTIGGLATSAVFRDRLVSMSVTLNNGRVSDQLVMTFDAGTDAFNMELEAPDYGKEISVSLGYEAGITKMGDFTVNQVDMEGASSGRKMVVSATPNLMLTQLRRTWSEESIADIVNRIAGEHELTARVNPLYETVTIDVVNQTDTSDLQFLTGLAQRYNAVCKPMAGNLLFMEKGQGTSASGLPMLPVIIEPHDVMQWKVKLTERQLYRSVSASCIDWVNAEYFQIVEASTQTQNEDSAYRLPHPYASNAEAEAAARAKLQELNRGESTLVLTLVGNPDITAEGTIIVSGVHKEINRTWVVKSVTHGYDPGGYQTSLEAYIP